MINIEQQQKLLLSISKRLRRKITAYAIGGTAMIFLGFKEATLDIDMVFESNDDRKVFVEAVKYLGFQGMDAIQVYGARRDAPEMFTLGDVRFDLFLLNVVDFIFSENMQKRAEAVHQFGDNLILKVADPHDIILMKCATDRLKDKDDARKIIESRDIKWSILIDEAKKQIQLGKERAVFDLGCFLEDLKYEMNVNIPISALDELIKILKKQINEKAKKRGKL